MQLTIAFKHRSCLLEFSKACCMEPDCGPLVFTTDFVEGTFPTIHHQTCIGMSQKSSNTYAEAEEPYSD